MNTCNNNQTNLHESLTPLDEVKTLEQLPERFTREEIFAMVEALQKDINQEGQGLSAESKVHRFAPRHRVLLVAMPFLYRTVCRGTYRREVVDAVLTARDMMDQGVSKEKAFEQYVKTAVDDVNRLRQKETQADDVNGPDEEDLVADNGKEEEAENDAETQAQTS